MTQPVRETYRIIKVTDQFVRGVAGLKPETFTVVARVQASPEHIARPFAHAATFADMGSGFYDVVFTLPTEPGLWTMNIEHAEHRVWNGRIDSATHEFDFDEPVATATA